MELAAYLCSESQGLGCQPLWLAAFMPDKSVAVRFSSSSFTTAPIPFSAAQNSSV
jgi:hypothetical protein